MKTASSATTTSNSSSTSNNRPATASAEHNRSDEFFTQLVTAIGQYMGQVNAGQQPGGNISDFISSLGERYVVPQGECKFWFIM